VNEIDLNFFVFFVAGETRVANEMGMNNVGQKLSSCPAKNSSEKFVHKRRQAVNKM
jgi:hypothetical protein